MASTIILRTVSSVDDKRIKLSNSRFAREIPFTWNKMRLALRLSMTGVGANITATPRLVLGVCSGNTNIFGDATTTHFIGARQNEPTWTDTGSNRYLVNGSTWENLKRVGVTDTTGTSLGLNGVQWGISNQAATTFNRTALFLDITKGSPNFTLRLFGWNNSGAAPADLSLARFLELSAIELPVETAYQHATAQTLAVNEGTDGTLNHINIHWDRTVQNIEISDIALARFA